MFKDTTRGWEITHVWSLFCRRKPLRDGLLVILPALLLFLRRKATGMGFTHSFLPSIRFFFVLVLIAYCFACLFAYLELVIYLYVSCLSSSTHTDRPMPFDVRRRTATSRRTASAWSSRGGGSWTSRSRPSSRWCSTRRIRSDSLRPVRFHGTVRCFFIVFRTPG